MGLLSQVRSLIGDAEAQANAERSAAQATYVDLLTSDTGDADDVTALREAMATLGIDQAQATKDRQTIVAAQALKGDIESNAGVRAARAALAISAHLEWTKAQIKALEEQHAALSRIRYRFDDRVSSTERLIEQWRKLKTENAAILANVESPASDILDQAGTTPGDHIADYTAWQAAHQQLANVANWTP